MREMHTCDYDYLESHECEIYPRDFIELALR